MSTASSKLSTERFLQSMAARSRAHQVVRPTFMNTSALLVGSVRADLHRGDVDARLAEMVPITPMRPGASGVLEHKESFAGAMSILYPSKDTRRGTCSTAVRVDATSTPSATVEAYPRASGWAVVRS